MIGSHGGKTVFWKLGIVLEYGPDRRVAVS